MRLYGILVVIVGLLMGVEDNKKDSSKAELDKLQGAWNAVSFEANGQKAPEEMVKKTKFTVKENSWNLERGDRSNKGTIKIDPTKTPKQFDALLEGSGDPVFGLYEVKGDTLKMCWTGPGGERPTAFTGDEGKTLAVYKKAKSN